MGLTCRRKAGIVHASMPGKQQNRQVGLYILEAAQHLIAGQAGHDAQIILRTTLLGLTDISQAYPAMVKLYTLNGRNIP